MVVAALGLLVANSPAAPAYFTMLEAQLGPLSVLHWVNDGLMAVFFLLVGLEIKREFLDGQLSTWSRRILPGLAAAGGMIAPALVYRYFNADAAETLRGWAIPTATDIAFALGVLALLGSRIPVSLKVFLTALAIIDDLGAVIIIAIFYTTSISLLWLGVAALTLLILLALNRTGVERLTPYLLLGLVLWIVVLRSGVHATVAGVLLALTVPLKVSPGRPDHPRSPLHILEHALHPWVAFLVIPLFGFANAGVALSGFSVGALLEPVTLGVAAGLFIGKQAGVFLTTIAAIRFNWADCPQDASIAQLYGVSVLCGIGFTMSLFIGLLSFPSSPDLEDAVKIGVLSGSLLSALAGITILRIARGERRPERHPVTASTR